MNGLPHKIFIAFFLPLFVFGFSRPLSADLQKQNLPEVQTYDQLLQAIRETRHASQTRIEQAVDQEKVREAWETGKLIDGHILLHQERADYGQQVIIRLAKDLASNETELKYALQFARTYPIRPPADELSWGHYRELLSINDLKEREELTKEAVRNQWNRDQIREEIRKHNASPLPLTSGGNPEWIEVQPGKIGTYRIVRHEGHLKIDLGFSTYLDVPAEEAKKFREGDFVDSGFQKAPGASVAETDLFTYQAKAAEVVDGDTFHAVIDLGFGITLEQRLRLRRLDAPEIVSAEGKVAKAALEKILARARGPILIKASKADDQYGRYLADVWVNHEDISQELVRSGVFEVREDL